MEIFKKVAAVILLFSLSSCSNNLQKSKSISISGVKYKILKENIFWDIISTSREGMEGHDKQMRILLKEIAKLSQDEIIGFRLQSEKLLLKAHTSKMRCAGYLMTSECSDESFLYFKSWVISCGKETFYAAIKNPDILNGQDFGINMDYMYEDFMYLPFSASNSKLETTHLFFRQNGVFKNEKEYPSININWNSNSPETISLLCPNLFERFKDRMFCEMGQ